MRVMRALLVACCLFVVGSAVAEPAAPLATLERTPGLGRSPSYKLAVFDDGSVAYEGKMEVKLIGKAKGQLTPAQVEALRAAFEAAGYDKLKEEYQAPPHKETGWVTTSYRKDGKTKVVRHRASGADEPERVRLLEDAFEKIVGSARWTGQ